MIYAGIALAVVGYLWFHHTTAQKRHDEIVQLSQRAHADVVDLATRLSRAVRQKV